MSNAARIAAALLILSACGPSNRNSPGDDDSGGGGGGGTDGGGGGGGGGGSSCASETVTAEQIPLDMYVMLDQSSSMTDMVAGGGDKWDAVTSALDSFVMESGLDGIAMGLGYFAVGGSAAACPVSCGSDADCGATCGPCFVIPSVGGLCEGAAGDLGGDSCNATDYATPAVGIAALPGVAPQITSSIAAHSPTTGTPTVQALEGALDYAKAWGTAHAGDAVVVVLATDGEPDDSCTPEDVPSVEGVAAGGVSGTPSIRTFVIGVGDALTDLNGIAAAGGTGSAFLVDTGSDVDAQFLAALNVIRHSVLGCTYQIPQPTNGQMLDYGEVNVVYTPGSSGMPETIPNVPNAGSCPATGNAWYYDNPSSPTQIILCTPTCNTVQADTAGTVGIELGCATVIQ